MIKSETSRAGRAPRDLSLCAAAARRCRNAGSESEKPSVLAAPIFSKSRRRIPSQLGKLAVMFERLLESDRCVVARCQASMVEQELDRIHQAPRQIFRRLAPAFTAARFGFLGIIEGRLP